MHIRKGPVFCFILYLNNMKQRTVQRAKREVRISTEQKSIRSVYLSREVQIDFYFPFPVEDPSGLSLLLINDGQDMEKMNLASILRDLYKHNEIRPVLCVGIHAGKDRKNEYGTVKYQDYKKRGAKAGEYTRFIFDELLPFIRKDTGVTEFREKAFAGFSLGGLMAIDIVWNFPHEFSNVGVFSGSFWWRSRGLDEGYVEETDRIMHAQIREGEYAPWLRFFFQTGALDEVADRNNNGIIDSIDDTIGLIDELVHKGYKREMDIHYLEIEDGKHDVPTWGRAMPVYLKWAFGRQ